MPKPTAQGFWTGYAKANDDIRHTYEQVFYGRQTTADLTEQEVPGMAKASPDATAPGTPPGATPESPATAPPPHAHADLYTRIWGPAPSADAGAGQGVGPTQGPDLANGQVQPPSPNSSPATGITAPPIEAPAIEPPRQGNDLTPE